MNDNTCLLSMLEGRQDSIEWISVDRKPMSFGDLARLIFKMNMQGDRLNYRHHVVIVGTDWWIHWNNCDSVDGWDLFEKPKKPF